MPNSESLPSDPFNEVKPFSQNGSNKHLTNSPRRRQMVSRQYSTPDVTRMIADAYHVVDQQLGRFRAEASFSKFDIKDASVLHKLVCTLKILEDAEQKRIQALQLNALSKESLELLAEQAAKFADTEDS
jgi:hypothetical protein